LVIGIVSAVPVAIAPHRRRSFITAVNLEPRPAMSQNPNPLETPSTNETSLSSTDRRKRLARRPNVKRNALPLAGLQRVPSISELSPTALRIYHNRLRIMTMVAKLRAEGWTSAKACKAAGTNPSLIWRWQKNPIPQLFKNGRKSPLADVPVPNFLIGRVQRLRLAGHTNDAAWRHAVKGTCPAALRIIIENSAKIPDRFTKLAQITRRRATVIHGADFSVVQEHEQ
jgi:hypothetical protein